MLDLLSHFAALDVLRARLESDVSSGVVSDIRAVDALHALEAQYPFAVLGSVVDHLVAHAGTSDTEVALLQDAESNYVDLRAFSLELRDVRLRIEQIAQNPLASSALSDYNAALSDMGDLLGRFDPLVAQLQAYAWKLQPLHHLVQHPRALDMAVKDWPARDVLLGRRTGAFAAEVMRLARDLGTAEALAFGVGVMGGYTGNVFGSPYLSHAVSGPRRSHPYRDRVASYSMGAWLRYAPAVVPMSFDSLRFVPVFGSPQNPTLPSWLSSLIKEALDTTYGGAMGSLPDVDPAYAQLVTHWRLLNSFTPLPPPRLIEDSLNVRIANNLSPKDFEGPGPSHGQQAGPAPDGGSGGNIFDPGPGQPPWFRPTHQDAESVIAEVCLDILFLPILVIRAIAYWHRKVTAKHPPAPSSLGEAKTRLQTPITQADLDGTMQGKDILLGVHSLSQMDLCLHSIATGCLKVMKVAGLLYPDVDDVPNPDFRQFVVLPPASVGFAWPARPPANPQRYLDPAGLTVERPSQAPSGFAPWEKPGAFLVKSGGEGAAMYDEGFAMLLQELLEEASSPVRVSNLDLDADRGAGGECWTLASGTSIQDDPVSPVIMGYADV